MAASIKAVIWDMGGVLLQEHDPRPRAKLAETYGLELRQLYEMVFRSDSANLASQGVIAEEEHWEWVRQTAHVPAEEMNNFQVQFWSGDGVDPSIISFIKELKGSYKTALLSNAWSLTRMYLKEYYNVLDLFDEVIISSEVKLAKPDPAIYQKMLNLLHIQPEEAIFVDDMQVNVDAANALGIRGVHFKSSAQAISDIRQMLNQ